MLVCTLALGGNVTAKATVSEDATTSSMLVPVGKTVGIKLFADGVMVVALSELSETSVSPASQAGLRDGDIITTVNSVEITSAEQFIKSVTDCNGNGLDVTYTRDGEEYSTVIKPVMAKNGEYKIGAWIRDSMAGIGTVTFYDPATGVFGALGHGINDVDTGILMPLQKGSIMRSSVAAVNKGSAGEPGELRGEFELTKDLGSLYTNSDVGVFGVVYDNNEWQGTAVPVAKSEEIVAGDATILANTSGESVCEYQIEILKVDTECTNNRNMLIKITDERLISETSGIVQGMSGSPILQDGKIIGAVTHVLVNDPQMGYGVFIENMLDAAYEQEQQAAS